MLDLYIKCILLIYILVYDTKLKLHISLVTKMEKNILTFAIQVWLYSFAFSYSSFHRGN